VSGNTINLHKLAFHYCTLGTRDLKAVLSLSNLKELHIIRLLHLWDERELYNAAFEQVKLISLETLNLDSCHNLDSKGFKALMKGTTKLKYVNLCYLYRIKGYTDIFAECNLEPLETFQAVSCSGLLACDLDVLKQSQGTLCTRIVKGMIVKGISLTMKTMTGTMLTITRTNVN
jgi:hypothetical protein